jgi:aspartokinase
VLADLCGDRLAFTVQDLDDSDSLRASLDTLAAVRLKSELAMVCAVGEGLAADPRVAADALAALHGLTVHLVARPQGQRTLAFVVDATHAAAAMARLHDGFFGVAQGRAPASHSVVQA